MRGGEQCWRGEKREEREVCAGHRPVAALQTVLLCCEATGNPSLDQVFISLSLFFPIPYLTLCYSVLPQFTLWYYELKGTKGRYTRIQYIYSSTLLLVKIHRTKDLFVCNPSWCHRALFPPPSHLNRTTGALDYEKRFRSIIIV